MKIKILRRKRKSSAATDNSANESLNLQPAPSKLHSAITIGLYIFIIVVAVNIVGNYLFNSKTVYVSVQPKEAVTGAMSKGTIAPDFILSNTTNGKISNSNFKGTPFIILFWATWNQLSVDQMRVVDNYISDNPTVGIKALAINSQEDKSLVSSFIKRGGYNLPVALDTNGSVGELYGAHYLPAIYFVDSSGVVRSSSVGYLDETALTRQLDALNQ